MQPFRKLTAVAAPLIGDHIDTDQIFPARFIGRDRKEGHYGTYFLHDRRFDEKGNKRTDFILNDVRMNSAKILVASAEYACGSGRPGVIFSHLDFGISAVIAESFGPVFSSVAYKSGLLTIQLEKPAIETIQRQLLQTPGMDVTIDLECQTVTAPDQTVFRFEIDDFIKRMILEGSSEIELTLSLEAQINAFEVSHSKLLPWIFSPPEKNKDSHAYSASPYDPN